MVSIIILRPYLQYGRKTFLSPRAFFYVYLPIARFPQNENRTIFNLKKIVTKFWKFAVECEWNSKFLQYEQNLGFFLKKMGGKFAVKCV